VVVEGFFSLAVAQVEPLELFEAHSEVGVFGGVGVVVVLVLSSLWVVVVVFWEVLAPLVLGVGVGGAIVAVVAIARVASITFCVSFLGVPGGVRVVSWGG
jgi:hypothetical protein